MAYSRWSSSDWYTFWEIRFPGEPQTDRDTAKLVIIHSGDEVGVTSLYFTAKQLRESLADCLDEVQEKVPQGDIEELEGYISKFLAAVDREHPAEG